MSVLAIPIDKTEVLNHINLTIEAGKTFAIVGPSGSGKSTIANLIPRFYELNSGTISIDGENIQDITLKSLRKNIGMVQQDVFLFWGSVAENIAYGKPDATMDEIKYAAKMAGADEFIEKLPDGYNSYVGERGVKLSGGQKQRISIARVFLKIQKSYT
jgi:ABC-type multidrug transport system, ATPase and permease components